MPLYQKHNYTNKDLTLVRTTIREYDMSEGGFSLIKEYSLLPKKDISYLETNFDKKGRHIEIGIMIRENEKLGIKLMDAFIEARKLFFEANDIKDEDILSIKKDAIFVIDKKCDNLEFGNIKFNMKNRYSSYIKIDRCEFYYSIWKDKLDVKGVSNKKHPLLERFKYFISCNETLDKDKMYRLLANFRKEYLERELDLEFYRELNSDNGFKVKKFLEQYNIFREEISEELIEEIDISFNYIKFIVPLISILI